MDKMGELFLAIYHTWCFLTEIFGIMLNFHIFSAVKSLNVKMT